MARMYDEIIAGGLRMPGSLSTPGDFEAWKSYEPALRSHLKGCEVIVADNVARYLFEGTDQERWDIKTDFPCCAPPFESFWIEFKAPRTSVSKESGITQTHPDTLGTGILFRAQTFESLVRHRREMTTEELDDYHRELERQAAQLWAQMDEGRRELVTERLKQVTLREVAGGVGMSELTAGERTLVAVMFELGAAHRGVSLANCALPADAPAWVMSAEIFAWSRRFGPIGPCFYITYRVGSNGAITHDAQTAVFGSRIPEAAEHALPMTFAALLALSFLNCKNVRRTMNEPPAPLSRKHQKKTGKPLCRFWTLEIEPMREILRREGHSEATGLKRALHICRGHFASYDEKPLFGRYTGRFWKAAHVRGSIKEGIVDKVYAIGETQ